MTIKSPFDIDYEKYCNKCVHRNKSESDEPCCFCLFPEIDHVGPIPEFWEER